MTHILTFAALVTAGYVVGFLRGRLGGKKNVKLSEREKMELIKTTGDILDHVETRTTKWGDFRVFLIIDGEVVQRSRWFAPADYSKAIKLHNNIASNNSAVDKSIGAGIPE